MTGQGLSGVVPFLLAALLLAACGGDEGGRRAGPASTEAGSDLAGIPLQEDEAPPGLRLDEELSGEVSSIREVLPPRDAFPNLPPLPGGLAGSFRTGYETVFASNADEEVTSAGSTVIRFAEAADASRFLAYLETAEVEAGREETREDFPAEGLGDEGYGWHEEEPFSESFGYVWRSGDLLLTVTVAGTTGATSAEAVLDLARRVDARTS